MSSVCIKQITVTKENSSEQCCSSHHTAEILIYEDKHTKNAFISTFRDEQNNLKDQTKEKSRSPRLVASKDLVKENFYLTALGSEQRTQIAVLAIHACLVVTHEKKMGKKGQ